MSTRDKIAALLEAMNEEVFMDAFNDIAMGQEALIKEFFIAAFKSRGVNDEQYKTDAYLLAGALLNNVMDYFEKYHADELSDEVGDEPDSTSHYDTARADDINAQLKVGYAS